MRKVGVIYGMENTFPPALVERINSKKTSDVTAEHIRIGCTKMAEPSGYSVIIDRISQDIEFYRTYLKNAALNGTVVINNPFWCSADDRFFNYSLAAKSGVAVPRTVLIPQKQHPPGTTVQSMRNLEFPLDWNAVFDYVGFPAHLKPVSVWRWKNVLQVNSPEEFFRAYDQTDSTCMILQSTIQTPEHYRCFVVGGCNVRVAPYDPKAPHQQRYGREGETPHNVKDQLLRDSVALCETLGYELNMIEFAMQDGVPYAIDLLNPVPNADIHTIGPDHFEWLVENVAQFAIERALAGENTRTGARWSHFVCEPSAKAAFTA